jgi:serine/threonine-protein kinase
MMTLGSAIWWGAMTIATAFISRTIYGLVSEVSRARRLGQYTLEEKIGEGGMGVVFRARHALLRRPTVVKLLPLDRAGHANLARFEREVQLTSQLSSPNTVAVYDFGRTPDGTFYYAMEYLDGVDLDKLVAEDGAQPASRVIHMMLQVCRALAEAHDAGLVHRDIKPGNVMMCRHGGGLDVVKVLDFGLVKDVTDSGDVKLTHVDSFIGTPLYLSPEGISEPDRVGARSDLYSVGCLGYFLLTGHPVFAGRTVAELCGKHLYEPPVPPSRRGVANVPADLESVLLACLEKLPEMRPEDARSLAARLRACADAGRWTEEQARAWWQARASKTRPKQAIASAPTLPDERRARPA